MVIQLDGESDGFGVDGSRRRDGLARSAALENVDAHGFENAFLCSLDAPPNSVHTGKVFAIGIVLLAFSLDRDRIAVEGHQFTMLPRSGRSRNAPG